MAENLSVLFHNCCVNINTTPVETFRDLLNQGVDINQAGPTGTTPLHYAVLNFQHSPNSDNVNALSYLLTRPGADLDKLGRDNTTILHNACRNVKNLPFEIFSLLLKGQHNSINVQNRDQDTPIHVVLTKITTETDINIITSLFTALEAASTRTPIKNDQNSELDGQNGHTIGKTPVIDTNKAGVLNMRKYSILHLLCQKIGFIPIEIFKTCVRCGVDIMGLDFQNRTPLHYCLSHMDNRTDMNILIFLLQQSHEKMKNFTPIEKKRYQSLYSQMLSLACLKINIVSVDVLKFLIEKCEADIYHLDPTQNYPPFHLCVIHYGAQTARKTPKINKKKISSEAKTEITNENGNDPPSPPINTLNFEYILNKHGIDVNHQHVGSTLDLKTNLLQYLTQPLQLTQYLLDNKLIGNFGDDFCGENSFDQESHQGVYNIGRYVLWFCTLISRINTNFNDEYDHFVGLKYLSKSVKDQFNQIMAKKKNHQGLWLQFCLNFYLKNASNDKNSAILSILNNRTAFDIVNNTPNQIGLFSQDSVSEEDGRLAQVIEFLLEESM
jgi:hypothetical protein